MLFGAAGSVRASQESSNVLPDEVLAALRNPDKVTLYSIEMAPGTGKNSLYGFRILGHVELNAARSSVAIQAFESAVANWNGVMAECFNARHAMRVEANHHTYDLLLCYECHQLEAYRDGRMVCEIGATGSPKVLNGLLTSAGIPLAKPE
jgi:hypothetical protein